MRGPLEKLEKLLNRKVGEGKFQNPQAPKKN
jgi:hypothetical protein